MLKLRNKYFLLRHGESLKNIKNIAACWPEKIPYPLTKVGERQIKEVVKKIKKQKINLIFASDLLRAKQTAEIVGKELELKVKFDKRLREVNVGILNDRPVKEVGKFWNKEGKLPPLEYYLRRFQFAPSKGETYTQIEKKMSEFIKKAEKKYQEKNILIVGHQRSFTLLEKAIYGYDLRKFVEIIIRKKEIKTGEMRKLKTIWK